MSTNSIEGPLGLSINQLETIHALVGRWDGKRMREKSSKPMITSVQRPLSDETTTEPPTSDDSFCFIHPNDIEYLTNYLLLLFAQVKKGVMNEDDRAKANRSSSLLIYGFRCRHCGGRERVRGRVHLSAPLNIDQSSMIESWISAACLPIVLTSTPINPYLLPFLYQGSYFPSTKKNLQACTATLHTHLITCKCFRRGMHR